MLYLVKHVMEQYQLLIAKRHDDALRNNTSIEKLNPFCDLELIFGLHAILPLLNYVYTLIKFAHFRNIFVCDFIDVMKICQLELYWFYNDPYNKFDDLTFNELKALETFTNKKLPMNCCVDLNGEEADYLIIEFSNFRYSVN